ADDRVQVVRVPQDADEPAVGGVAEADRAILPAGGQGLAVGRERDRLGVPKILPSLARETLAREGRVVPYGQAALTGGDVPDPDRRLRPAGRREDLAIGGERQLGVTARGMVLQRPEQ